MLPRYHYEPLEQSSLLPIGSEAVIDSYVRRDAITDGILEKARSQYGAKVTKDDVFFYVYGALHSSSYRERYANDLKKELARLPLSSPGTFGLCVRIGRELVDVHLNYETGKSTLGDRFGKPHKKLEPTPLWVINRAPSDLPDSELYRVEKKMRLGTETKRFEDGSTRKVFDGTLKYNDYLTFSGCLWNLLATW